MHSLVLQVPLTIYFEIDKVISTLFSYKISQIEELIILPYWGG